MKLPNLHIENEFIKIIPFKNIHFDALLAAGSEWSLWKHYIDKPANEAELLAYLKRVMDFQEKGQWRAHTIFTPDNKCVGQTCYMALRLENDGLEIGGTWYNPQFHGTKINPAAKLALLNHAFENGAKRVELKTDALNSHSRAAILKLGAKFEGIFRKHMIRKDGTMRDSAYYSIIDSEWDEIKKGLLNRLKA